MSIDWTWVGIATSIAVAVILSRFWRAGYDLVPGESKMHRLISRKEVNYNTRIFRFALSSSRKELGLPIGKHIIFSATIDDKPVSKAYTPVEVGVGYFDLLVKVYFPTERFPQGGRMSQYLEHLTIGSSIMMKGPSGGLEYLGGGRFSQRGKVKQYKKVGMIAGGTGITPMLQIVKAACKEVECFLLFANQSPEDILLKDAIDSAGFAKITYTVDRPDKDWTGSVGFIDKNKVSLAIPKPDSDLLVLVCGPPPMIELACKPSLDALGYEDIHFF